ncbi:hypothetical protein AJ80_02063 [Polytolypa hystricis UAMH7299]|uniref:Sulfhydryl oxidase n=1 Tax=Polytolypa hystricis (strain UAMH7299) TaxID=1447883 RepID=A0A2B7YR75_POLH7|nr:hypothetical protein AJ80_02063 [Polytolypa hystricis UAMH7299]
MADLLTEQIDALEKQRNEKYILKGASPGLASDSRQEGDQEKAKLPKGVVLGPDGKPCRTCTSISDWRALTKMKSSAVSSSSNPAAKTTPVQETNNTSASSSSIPDDCPADVETLGRNTWTLLHTMTANYPKTAPPQLQNEMQSFLSLFSKLYPCWICADDFRTWMNNPSGQNKPRVKGRAEFGNWMCEAHNEVNRKLGKKEFDCSKWEERWRTGWKDGRCD